MTKHKIEWAYGVTTVPSRIEDPLPHTLKSLASAGFDNPRLFIDGVTDVEPFKKFNLDITARFGEPALTVANWFLTLSELYFRQPSADFYVVFQDDFLTYTNLRAYLERIDYPAESYFNLYTFPSNQTLCSSDHEGWFLSNQLGRGAVALIFPQEAILKVLSHDHMLTKPKHRTGGGGVKCVDGAISVTFKKLGWKEYVHNPSLVQHTGIQSSMGNRKHQQANSFLGKDFNALDLLKEKS